MSPALLRRALADPHPGVRRHAIRLCERQLPKAANLGDDLVKLVADADPRVRMQLAYTLGEWTDARAGDALGRLALHDAGDKFLLAAVMSSVHRGNLDRVLLTVMKGGDKGPPPPALVEGLLRLANALGDKRALLTLLTAVSTPEKNGYAPWQFGVLAGLLDSLDERKTPLAQLRKEGSDEWKAALTQLAKLFDAARAVLANDRAAMADKLLAIRLLGRGLDHQQEDLAVLAALLVPQTAGDLQSAAIAALGRLRSPRMPELLLRGWQGHAPAQRNQVLDILFGRDDWLTAALEAIERKQIVAAEINAVRRQRLLAHRSDDVPPPRGQAIRRRRRAPIAAR